MKQRKKYVQTPNIILPNSIPINTERNLILRTLSLYQGNMARAASALGYTTHRFVKKFRKYVGEVNENNSEQMGLTVS